jgi:hypothetical protein
MSGMLLNLIVAGLVVGFMIGLTGVGSGALMAPVLLLLGIPPATVVGSDLLFGLLTKIVGVGSHLQHKTIAWRWVWLMAIGSLPGVLIGTRILAHFAGAPSTIRFLIGVVLVMTPVLAILMEIARRRHARWVEQLRHPSGPAIAAIGAAIGITVGATSVASSTWRSCCSRRCRAWRSSARASRTPCSSPGPVPPRTGTSATSTLPSSGSFSSAPSPACSPADGSPVAPSPARCAGARRRSFY